MTQAQTRPPSAATFELVATAVPQHDVAGRDILINVALFNRSLRPVTVNRRMVVNNASSPQVEIAVDVTGPDGKKLDFTKKIRIGDPDAGDFVELAAGGRAVARVDLADDYGVSAPGKYTVVARYSSKDQRGWVGDVVAAAIVVDVLPPPPIGDVEMLADRKLKLIYRHPWSTDEVADGDPEHARILAHVGAMKPGDKKLIPPWPDDIDDSRVARTVAHHVATELGWQGDEWNHEIRGTAKDGAVMVGVTFLADSGKSVTLEIERPAYAVR